MTTNEKPSNPLKQYYRAPKLYTSLPSAGQYNDIEEKSGSSASGAVEASVDINAKS